jgi:hypothetical protein
MKKFIAVCFVLTLSACSEIPTQQPVVDTQCQVVASYARTVDTLKRMNVGIEDLDQYSVKSSVLTFPYKAVRLNVYSNNYKTPTEAFTVLYTKCLDGGYNNLLVTLREVSKQQIIVEQTNSEKLEDLAPSWNQQLSPFAGQLKMSTKLRYAPQ